MECCKSKIMKKQFLLLHGWMANEATHWQTLLAKRLMREGYDVLYPLLPDPDHPRLLAWLSALEGILQTQETPGLTVLTHSLGGSLWMQYLSRHPKTVVQRVFLVAPTPEDIGIHELKDFFPLPHIDLGDQKDHYLIVCSDDDPYIKKEMFQKFSQESGIPLHLISRAGHINVAAGFGEWDWMWQQCVGE